MTESSSVEGGGSEGGAVVPNEVVRAGHLPPMRYREMPAAVSWRKMIGPSIILAGLALGSGEFVIWPYITYQSRFIFFWACLLGVMTQYFINMEIARWTLVTGESAMTGFMRLGRIWGAVFLLLNIVPWMIPAWSTQAAQMFSWLIWAPELVEVEPGTFAIANERYVTALAIAGMFLCGAVLTLGPVIYETVERIQIVLVGLVLVLVVILAVWLVRWDAVQAMVGSTLLLKNARLFPDELLHGIDATLLLGALAFAGAGGTTNLGQSNYIKDKGYGMGRHIGRITSPITGQEEAVSEIGYHFPHTEENLHRWRQWWRAACVEHFLSFFMTCLVCLVLLTLISYSIFYDASGQQVEGAARYRDRTNFILGEAEEVGSVMGAAPRMLFLLMGIAILLTTEFGILDVVSRISAEIVKVRWLFHNSQWTESRLYYVFLWGTILLATGILLLKSLDVDVSAFALFKASSAMNGAVMFLYSFLLLVMNRWRLPKPVRISGWRMLIMVWAVLFFGAFAAWAGYQQLTALLAWA